MMIICSNNEKEPAAQLKSAAPPPLEGVPPCRDDDSTAAPTLEEASRPTTPLGAAAEAAEAAEAAGRALLECPWHDALAFFLATRDLGRCSQASPGLLRELTVAYTIIHYTLLYSTMIYYTLYHTIIIWYNILCYTRWRAWRRSRTAPLRSAGSSWRRRSS